MTTPQLSFWQQFFEALFGSDDPDGLRLFFAPGRINLIGEHLDYNGGPVLPAAIDLGIHALVRPNSTKSWRLASVDSRDFEDQFDLEHPAFPPGSEVPILSIELEPLPLPAQTENWGSYVAGMLVQMQALGIAASGLDVLLWSDLPRGAGLSSSAALEVLIGLIAVHLSPGNASGLELARAAQSTEDQYLGVQCGIMDPYAIAYGAEGMALMLDCATETHRLVQAELPGYRWVVINSGISRTLAGSAYNERRKACEEAAALLGLEYLAQLSSTESIDELKEERLRSVARHVYSECRRVEKAVLALEEQNVQALGMLLQESHASLRDDFKVSCPEMDVLVELANEHEACAGARMTGAGFGGCALALVAEGGLQDFHFQLFAHYQKQTGKLAEFWPVRIFGKAREIRNKFP